MPVPEVEDLCVGGRGGGRAGGEGKGGRRGEGKGAQKLRGPERHVVCDVVAVVAVFLCYGRRGEPEDGEWTRKKNTVETLV